MEENTQNLVSINNNRCGNFFLNITNTLYAKYLLNQSAPPPQKTSRRKTLALLLHHTQAKNLLKIENKM